MCPAIPISTIYGGGIENWNASAYAALSVASRLSGIVRQHGAIIAITRLTWRMDSTLRHFLRDIYRAVDDAERNPPPPPKEPITAEQIIELANTFRKLHRIVESVYMDAKSKGLTNRALAGAALNSAKVRGEEILEIGESLELALNSDVDALLERSREDLRNGRVYDLPVFK